MTKKKKQEKEPEVVWQTDEAPEPVEFVFRANLVGVKTKATKEGLRKVLTFEANMLMQLCDIDMYVEDCFDIAASPTWNKFQKASDKESQQELPLGEEHPVEGEIVQSDLEPGLAEEEPEV